MSNALLHVAASDPGAAAHRFFAIQELLATPELARFYTDLLINAPTTVTAARDRQGLSKSTAYKYANTLEELGIAEELNEHDNGSTLWRADPVIGVWNSETAVTLSPTVIAVYGATAVDDDLALFVDRHGKAALVPAISETIEYLNGNTTRRGIAAALDVPAVEGIAVSQAIERIIGVVRNADPSLEELSAEVEIHERVIEQAPYQRVNE
jgi:hypothetical protein